jgi:uncharacterized protein YjcR
MRRQYGFETRDKAEELYIVQGCTLEQVAAITGVSLSQIKAWSTTDNWKERREEYRLGIQANALATKDPQAVYAAASFERLAQYAEKQAVSDMTIDRQAAPAQAEAEAIADREIRTPQDAITALQDAAQSRLYLMLSQPDQLTLAAIKDLKQVMALIDELADKYKPEDKGSSQKGLSDEAAEEIRAKILGVKVMK